MNGSSSKNLLFWNMKWLLLFVLIAACTVETDPEETSGSAHASSEQRRNSDDLVDSLQLEIDRRMQLIGLVDIQSVHPGLQVDLKYAGTDNFMGVVLYDTLKRVYLQKNVADRLAKCQIVLDSLHPGYSLLVFDGVRPVQVQWEMWKALDSIPVSRRGKFVSNPGKGSVHNYGAAVDVTIVDESGKALDMGAGYDDFRKIAFPAHEAELLKSGVLSKEHVENRRLLRRVMAAQGFRNIPSEWWHFNAYSRISASHRFPILLTESGSSSWRKLVVEPKNQSDSLSSND